MSKRKFMPFGVVLLLVILALSTLGIGYGLWAETLIINGEVNTGELNAAFSLEEIDQLYDFNANCPDGSGYSIGQDCDGDGVLNDDWEWEEKDVGECTADLMDGDNGEPNGKLLVTITNGYPSFNCFIRYNVDNWGSIPMHVYGPDFFYNGTFYQNAINVPELHVNGWPPQCEFAYADYVQIEPGEAKYCNLHIHVNQPAEELATYQFEVMFFARQWNEYWEGPPWR